MATENSPESEQGDGGVRVTGRGEGSESVLIEKSRRVDQADVRGTLAHVLELYFPRCSGVDSASVRGLVDEAYRWADQTFGMEAAALWADGFHIPGSVVEASIAQWREAGGSLIEMARRARAGRHADRLSVERVRAVLSPDNPEWDRLITFGERGVDVLLGPDFVPSGPRDRPPLCRKYLATKGAVDRMIYDSYIQKGLAFVLPLDIALSLPESELRLVHNSPSSWHTKHNKPQGRNVMDASDGGPQGTGLNSEHVKLMADQMWGVITNPTLQSIAQMILDFFSDLQLRDPSARWEDLYLWKMDLAGAFTLLDFNPAHIPLLGTVLEGDLVVFFGCGIFGWTAMPAAFQVVNRGIRWELQRPGVLRGRMDMYTDDMFGVCLRRDLEHDMDAARSLCRGQLGPLAIEDSNRSGVGGSRSSDGTWIWTNVWWRSLAKMH